MMRFLTYRALRIISRCARYSVLQTFASTLSQMLEVNRVTAGTPPAVLCIILSRRRQRRIPDDWRQGASHRSAVYNAI